MIEIMVPLLWLAVVGLILSAANPNITAHVDGMNTDFPDSSDAKYATVFGTNYLDYLMDFLSVLGTRIANAGLLVADFTVWPTFSIYGQTADPTDFPPMILLQLVPIVWLAFAGLGYVPFVGGS